VKLAGDLMRQPGGVPPHDDHFHVRIYCAREDLLDGCRNLGPLRAGAPSAEPALSRRVARLVMVLRDRDAERRAGAATLLGLLDRKERAGDVARLASDRDGKVRLAAAQALGVLGVPSQMARLASVLRSEEDPDVAAAALDALDRHPGAAPARALAPLLRRQAPMELRVGPAVIQLSVAARAAALMGTTDDARAVPLLLAALDGAAPDLQAAITGALERLANRVTQSAALGDAAAEWKAWYARHRGRPRDKWLIEGFNAAGFMVPRLDQGALRPLSRAVSGPSPVSYNAQRVLMRLTGHSPPSLVWPKEDAAYYWARYVARMRR
jgi:hypothetical protein